MGIEYDLNDPAKGESFDFGKGWHGVEGTADYDRAPSAGGHHCQYHARLGPPYRWTPLKSRDETLHYVTSHFYFLETIDHCDECKLAHQLESRLARDDEQSWTCLQWCEFQEPDLEYANRFTDKLWAWLQGRDQSQLDITDDCSGDDIHCRKDDADHEKWCVPHLAKYPRDRHFTETGSRYD